MTTTLRAYQSAIVSACDTAAAAGHRRAIIILPTGAGKTITALTMPLKWTNRRWLLVVPSQEIFDQTARALTGLRCKFDTLKAGQWPDLEHTRVLLAMSQTLSRRLTSDLFEHWHPHGVFLDEVHKLIDQHSGLLDFFDGMQVFGMTATPWRLDNRSLFDLFPHVIAGPQLGELQKMNYLVREYTFPVLRPDLSKIKQINDEFDEGQIERVFLTERIMASVVESWRRLASAKRTIVFCGSVAVSKALVAVMEHNGIKAKHVDAKSTLAEREAAITELRSGRIALISNVGLFTEGLDIVEIECIILLFATLSLSRYMQAAGRGTRTSPKTQKRRLIIIDMGGNAFRFGAISARRDWQRNGMVIDPAQALCHRCGALQQGSNWAACDYCGVPRQRALPQLVPQVATDLNGIEGDVIVPPEPTAANPVRAVNLRAVRNVPIWALAIKGHWLEAEKARAGRGAAFVTVDARFLRPRLVRRAG